MLIGGTPTPTPTQDYIVDSTVSDHGAATSQGNRSIKDIVDSVGSNKATIILPHDPATATTTYSIDTSLDLSSNDNIVLEIQPGAIIESVTGDETITFGCSIVAGNHQIFGSSIRNYVSFEDGSIEAAIPEWFGAVGDCDIATGTGTDNYSAITAAKNSYNTIYFSRKIYGIEQTVILSDDDYTIISDDATLVGIPYATGPNYILSVGNTSPVFTATDDLDANALRGEDEIYLPSVFLATLQAGDVVVINSDKEYIGDNLANVNIAGELVKIYSVEADHIVIFGSLNDSYLTSDNAKVIKVDMYTFNTVGVLNLNIRGAGGSSGAATYLRWIKDSSININVFNDEADYQIGIINNCYNLKIDTHSTAIGGDGFSTTGASTSIKYRGFIECSTEAISCSGGIGDQGIPWNIDVSAQLEVNSKGVDAHYGTGSIFIHDCLINCGGGVGISALYNTISNCEINATTDAIRMRGPVTSPIFDVESFIVKNCRIETKGNYAVYLYDNDINNLEITGCRLKGGVVSTVSIAGDIVIGNWTFKDNYLENNEGATCFLMNSAGIELPSTVIIDGCTFAGTSYACYIGDETADTNCFAGLESLVFRNCTAEGGTNFLRLNNGHSAEKTLPLLSINGLLTDYSGYGIYLNDFSVTDLKLNDIECLGSSSDFVGVLSSGGAAFNISVDTLFAQNVKIVTPANLADGDAGNTVEKAALGINSLTSPTVVNATIQGSNYHEILNCNELGAPTLTRGYGTPNGAITADVGSMYLDRTGGASTTLYIKESGTGNTGWVAK